MDYFSIRKLSDAEVVSGLKSSVSDERKKRPLFWSFSESWIGENFMRIFNASPYGSFV
jgi:hypothetical protein